MVTCQLCQRENTEDQMFHCGDHFECLDKKSWRDIYKPLQEAKWQQERKEKEDKKREEQEKYEDMTMQEYFTDS